MKKNIFNIVELRKTVRKHILEQIENKEETKQRCLTSNVIPLDNIVGPSKIFTNYNSNTLKRNGGIHGMVDTLDLLKTLRLHPHISDSGEHLAYDLMNHLNTFRNKHYLDETNSQCQNAMDKVIELYKENEHGEDLVKDIEKVLSHAHPSPRAKEYLKRCIILVKEK